MIVLRALWALFGFVLVGLAITAAAALVVIVLGFTVHQMVDAFDWGWDLWSQLIHDTGVTT